MRWWKQYHLGEDAGRAQLVIRNSIQHSMNYTTVPGNLDTFQQPQNQP